jgi:acyl transferase domain-containing protein
MSRTAFLFPSQGGPWAMYAPRLLASDTVRTALSDIDEALRRRLGWSLLDAVGDEGSALMSTAATAQPAVTALQIAMISALDACGVTPDAVVGLSMGEIAAAVAADVLTLEDAVTVAGAQARAIQCPLPSGSMALVAMSADDADEFIRGRGGVWVGVELGPRATVLSGTAEAVAVAVAEAAAAGVQTSGEIFPFGYHSDAMLPIRASFLDSVAYLSPAKARLPFGSSVTGGLLVDERLDGSYWWQVMAGRSRFFSALAAVLRMGIERVVEVTPIPMLAGIVHETAAASGVRMVGCDALSILEGE